MTVLLLLFMCLLSPASSQTPAPTTPASTMTAPTITAPTMTAPTMTAPTMTADSGACGSFDLDTHSRATCEPCKGMWFELILNQRAGIDPGYDCFNDFPLGTNLPFPCPQDLTKGKENPELDLTKSPRGFIMSKLPFFRFSQDVVPAGAGDACEDPCPATCLLNPPPIPPPIFPPLPPAPSPENNLDVGNVEKYYNMYDSIGDLEQEVDIEVLEWPGRDTTKQTEFLSSKISKECMDGSFKSHKPYLCTLHPPKGPQPNSNAPPAPSAYKFQMLKFQREASKMLDYPCNKEEGTTIVALGLKAVYPETENDTHPQSKIFLSYGNLSIYNAHGHPLYVAEDILNQMEKTGEPFGICRSNEPPNCDFTDPRISGDCALRKKFFEDRGDLIMDSEKCTTTFDLRQCPGCRKIQKSLSGDLKTVLDFTFVEGRLLLGMRCGIIIIKDFLNKILNIRTASLLTQHGTHRNTFPPINKISSSFCCKSSGSGCRKTLVAAYSSYSKRAIHVPKELYVSFDLGDTFQVKLIAEHTSALNLMWGMYKLYGSWLLYYQLLENPDQEDLRDDRGDEIHPGYIDLRSVSDWDSLTLSMREKRFLYGETSSKAHQVDFEVKKRAMKRYLRLRTAGALGRFVRYRRLGKEIQLDLSPKWLQKEIGRFRSESRVKWREGKWTDANCDSIPDCRNNFIDDPAVKYFLNDSHIVVKTPKKPVEEAFCDQILSIAVLEEEDSLYALCRVGFGDFTKPFDKDSPSSGPISCSSRQSEGEDIAQPDCKYPFDAKPNQPSTNFPYKNCTNPIKFYAIYSYSVKEKLPFVLLEERRSERLFTCKPIIVPLDWDGCKNQYAHPELVRVPDSVSLLVKNCQDVLYYSPNGGRTIFNTQFYAHYSQFSDPDNITGDCDSSNTCTGPSQTPSPSNTTQEPRQLMYRLKALNVPPLIAISPSNTIVFMTMKNTYAFGLLGINKEFRMIVDEIFHDTDSNIISQVKSNDFVFPGFTYGNVPFFGVALKLLYSHNRDVSCRLYSNRHGMRLVHMDFFFYDVISYYYEGNQDLESEARANMLEIHSCHTYQFSVNPKSLVLDVDEGGIVEVISFDNQPNIHLGLVSSEEKSIITDVQQVDRGERKDKEHLAHDWDIHVKAIRNYKPRITALVDSFFGAENNNMFGFHTEIGLANDVAFRCHVQPSATVSVHIECRDARMVVHEDEHRPQCKKGLFSKSTFEYRLKKGDFDPNLAGYWMNLNEKEGKHLIKLDRDTGDLIIVYDYLRFGCPVEPYKDDPFVPDLRIATAESKYNSSHGQLYNGSFLLIELFGAKGYVFSKKYADYGCTYLPMNLSSLVEDWVNRQRMFRIVNGKQVSYANPEDILKAKTAADLDKLEYGNQLFVPDAVDHPINIVNRVTYRDCKKWRNFFLETENQTSRSLAGGDVTDDERNKYLAQPLQILERNGALGNKVIWSKKSQQVYIFMAVALDPTESLCEYYTIFGVHLPEQAEIDELITMLVFIFLVILWILLFVCGYLCRKRRIRTLCIQLERKRRLEEAAWKVVYQYEKFLQESENIKFEEEFNEFKNAGSKETGKQHPPRNTSTRKSKTPTQGNQALHNP